MIWEAKGGVMAVSCVLAAACSGSVGAERSGAEGGADAGQDATAWSSGHGASTIDAGDGGVCVPTDDVPDDGSCRGPGASCGGMTGDICCFGWECIPDQQAFATCMRATLNAAACRQAVPGKCFPEGSTPCLPASPIFPIGTCSPDAAASCCLELCGTGLYVCAEPAGTCS